MKNFLKVFIFFAVAGWLSGCGKPEHREAQFSMGTFVEVVSDDPRASEIVFDEFKRLESIFNLFDENSELSQLNARGALVASKDLFNILKKSKEYFSATGGAFDISVAPLSLIWKKAVRQKTMPGPDALKKARELVGLDSLYLDEATRRVMLMNSGMQLDLGGVAKGYALDQAVARLKESGVLSALINAGGNIYALGNRRGKPWKVGIRDPLERKAIFGKVNLENKGISTSGSYEQFFLFQNKRYSHIINPETGYPADSGIVSATVTAPDATTADVLSTMCVVLGHEKCLKVMAAFPGVNARLMDEKGKVFTAAF